MLIPKKKPAKASDELLAKVQDFAEATTNHDSVTENAEPLEDRLVFDMGPGRNMTLLGNTFINGIFVTDHEVTINELLAYGKQLNNAFTVAVYDESNPEHNRHAVKPNANSHIINGTHTTAHYTKKDIGLDQVFAADQAANLVDNVNASNASLGVSNLDPSIAVPTENLIDMSSLMGGPGGIGAVNAGTNSIIDVLNAMGADTGV